jgi:hypothetical protein
MNRPNDVHVVATDRSGSVFATSWNGASYNELVAVPV